MKATSKKIKQLITEAVIKYADGSRAVNASGIFSKEMLEQQFQKLYDESLEYQKSIISNPDGEFDRLLDELAQANAAAKLHRYLEATLSAKYGPGAAIIFNLSDYEPRGEKEIVDFPSLEKAVKRAAGYDVEHILYSGTSRDFPEPGNNLPSDAPQPTEPFEFKIEPIEGENIPRFDISTIAYDDDEKTAPRDEYEPTQPRQPKYEPTDVLPTWRPHWRKNM